MRSRANQLGGLAFVIILLALLGAAGWYLAGIEGWREPSNILYQYQTLIAGMLAIFSVVGVVWKTNRSIKNARDLEDQRYNQERKVIATSIIAEMTSNRMQLANIVDNLHFCGSVILAECKGEQHPFEVTQDVYDVHLGRIGILGADVGQRVIATYKNVNNSVRTFLALAPEYKGCVTIGSEGEKIGFDVYGTALHYLERLCREIMALDIALESLAKIADTAVHPDISRNLKQRSEAKPEEATYVPIWRL